MEMDKQTGPEISGMEMPEALSDRVREWRPHYLMDHIFTVVSEEVPSGKQHCYMLIMGFNL